MWMVVSQMSLQFWYLYHFTMDVTRWFRLYQTASFTPNLLKHSGYNKYQLRNAISINKLNWLGFIMEINCVFGDAGIKLLYIN